MITVYTGAAFVILSLVDMVREPFELPNWSFKLVVVLLSIGLIVAVILSWIYDFHPEGGLVKTEPAHKVKPEDIPKSSNNWKIASYISFAVIVGLIVLNIIPHNNKEEFPEILDKSIAVLPFINDSPDEEKMYFINGTMEAILDNLCKIEDLRVPGRTSVEQYRNNPKPIPEIAEELNVSYVLEGSGQKLGNRILLTVQLLNGEDGYHIWSKQYNRVIEKVEDLIDIQAEIARLVATEIEATITPEEKKRIEKAPTTSLMANELYQMGREEYIKFLLDVSDRDALTRARGYYLKALENDSTYAKACAGVAMTFYSSLSARWKLDIIYFDGYLEEDAFDTVFFWANMAIRIDKQLPEAYYIRGNYYYETGNQGKAEQDFLNAIQLNPNYWEAYFGLGNMYTGLDYLNAFKYFKKAASLVRGPELSYVLMTIISTYGLSGVRGQTEEYLAEYVDLTQDSLFHYLVNSWIGFFSGNLEDRHYWLLRAYAYDSTNPNILSLLAESYIHRGNFEKGLKYFKRSDDINLRLGRISFNRLHRIGYAFSLAGYKKEADYYFDRQEEICKSLIRLNRPSSRMGNAQFDLACIYAFRGEKTKAMEILRNLHQRSSTPYIPAWFMQWDPMLDGIRDDPEFQQIANDLGIKFQAETERVRQWLEENDMVK